MKRFVNQLWGRDCRSARGGIGGRGVGAKGFALVLTLSLMVLLSVVAIGLLGLSTISVRQGKAGADQAEAMANARLAVLMAIGQLQAQLGPDERVSVVADQLPGSTPDTTAANAARRRWTGVYDSWLATQKDRPTPQFRSWLVSGTPEGIAVLEAAKGTGGLGSPPAGRPQDVKLVGEWAAGGQTGQEVRAPLLGVTGNGAIAWWTGDENVKALAVERGMPLNETLNFVRSRMSAAPRRGLETAKVPAGTKPFEAIEAGDVRMPRLLDWPQTELVANPKESARALFHDLTTVSRGMLTNVTAGGFRKDFSLYLERSAPLNVGTRGAYYTVRGDVGINEEEIWTYYHLYDNRTYGLQWGTMPQYTTGGRAPRNTPYLVVPHPDQIPADDMFYFKHPVITSYQQVLSLWAKPAVVGGQQRYELRLVVDPILTYWNPLDVPVVVDTTGNSVKYWQLPYTLRLTIGAKKVEVPISRLISPGDRNVITAQPGKSQQIVMRPGEVMMMSQAGSRSTTPTDYSATRQHVDCTVGFNYGNGMAYRLKDQNNANVDLLANESISNYEIFPNDQTSGGPNGGSHSSYFSLTHHEWYVGEDRKDRGASYGFGGIAIDWGWGDRRLVRDSGGNVEKRPAGTPATKPAASRLRAINPDVAPFMKGVTLAQSRPLSGAQLSNAKAPVMLFSFNLKTETSADNPSRYFARFNRNALFNDFYNFSQQQLDMGAYEVQVEPLNSWKSPSLELTPGPAYLGGGHTALNGVSRILTHSIPREPVISLAALQHSLANGFAWRKREWDYAANASREPMLPQIGHAIGNSMACSVLAPEATEGVFAGVRPLADHSYLANRALFDDWFFSGIAPQTAGSFTTKRPHLQVAKDFFEGTTPLPNVNYRARLNDQKVDSVLNLLLKSTGPTADGYLRVANYIAVDGMFNVNSTSVEAWRALLSGLREHPLAVQGTDGGDKSRESDEDETVVSGLQTPLDAPIDPSGLDDMVEPTQWTGFRTLTDEDIEELSKAIVREVRRRGPFLSLADFVNRRVGRDKELARCGAVQAALDAPDVGINEDFTKGARALGVPSGRGFAFPEAEAGAAAYGAPGYVKQADLLTPIAPVLSARSDTFRIRGYGEKVGAGGQVLARAWCEAVVERIPTYVDASDQANEFGTALTSVSRKFGRSMRMISFRWLSPNEV